MIRIPEGSAPDFKNKSWTVAAEITVPESGADGMLVTMGGRFGGWGLWMADSKPHFAYALSNQPAHKFNVASDQPLSRGNHLVRLKFEYGGGGLGKGGTATLFVDEKRVAQGRIPQTAVVRFSLDETFDVGQDTGTPVVEDYVDKMPYAFTGTLKQVKVILEPEKLSVQEREQLRREAAKAFMAVQ
jgi:arylsulfatase